MVIGEVGAVPIAGALAWADLARLPLCLLHQGMQNRRILDARLAERGLELRPRVTADSYLALLGLVQQGRLCSIIPDRSEEHTSELQSLMRISYAVFCLKKKKTTEFQQHYAYL